MFCLAFDTAGPCCSVALVGAEGLLASASEHIGRGHAEHLMPMIDDVLGRSGKCYGDLNRVGVTSGPGSFTGVRIGVSAARGLALALGVKAVGIGVLEVLAEQAVRVVGPSKEMIIAAVLPAARDSLYIQAWRGRASDGALPLLPAGRMTIADVHHWLGEQCGPVRLAGSGAAALDRDDLIAPEPAGSADHADILILSELILRGDGSAPPRPLYLRPPDARPQSGMAVVHA